MPLDAKRRFFAPHRAMPDADGAGWRLVPAPADDEGAFFTGFSRGGKFMTFFGDNHPVYNGNVVKAMASARNGYRAIAEVVERQADDASRARRASGTPFARRSRGRPRRPASSRSSA